jgi:hypothetical protein
MDNKLEIIALSGQAGCGKDFIYTNFFKPRNYFRFALADHFKIWAIGRNLITYEEAFVTKPPHVRKILQQTGTEEGRNVYGDSIWLDTAYTWLHHFQQTLDINKWVITDVRFTNEADYVKDRGGKVFRIDAPNRVLDSKLTPEQRQHPSETSLNEYTKFDGYIGNDYGQEDDVPLQIACLMNEIEVLEDATLDELHLG